MKTSKILVGFLLLGSLVIFALATFYIENWQFYVKEGYRLDARFVRALELGTGDEVRIAGVEVGRVHSITVDPQLELPVSVTMWIRKGTEIRESDVAVIRMRSIFGGSFLEIERVDRQAPLLDDGDTIAATRVSLGVADVIEKSDLVLDEALGAFHDSRGALKNLSVISDRLAGGEGTLGRLLADESAYDELKATLQGAGRVLDDIAGMTEALQEGRGLAGRLLSDEELADRFEAAVTDAGKFAGMLADISEGFPDSSLGRLASDDEIYDSLKRTLGELEKAVAAVSTGTGTVGRLINDPELYNELRATVKGVQEIINEYREQSPILTFAGAVFGAL